MAAKKNNSKSIRLSDTVLEYIEKSEGRGFNEKFENIILYAMESEPNRIKEIAFLDEQIAKKKKELQKLSSRFFDCHQTLLACERLTSSLASTLKNVSQ